MPSPVYDDEVDLRQLVVLLWKQKSLIAGAVAVVALLGLGMSLWSTRYVSEGLFLTPGISAADYKRLSNGFTSAPRLQQYLQSIDAEGMPHAVLIRGMADDPEALRRTLVPEFAFTDKDEKALGVRVAEDDEPGAMIGVRIRFGHREPTGGAPVAVLGEFVRDTTIRVKLEGIMLERCARFRIREQELRNAQIQNDFAIVQEERRATNLREIVARNPGVASLDRGQIISIENGSERYLSPAAQLVAAEIKISDMKLEEARRGRERAASALKRDYYCKALQALQAATTGRAFLGELRGIQTSAFENQDQANDIVEQAWNELEVERENWASAYLNSMRFMASPESLEMKERKPSLAMGLMLGGVLGGMLGIVVALIRAWWRDNRDEIAADR